MKFSIRSVILLSIFVGAGAMSTNSYAQKTAPLENSGIKIDLKFGQSASINGITVSCKPDKSEAKKLSITECNRLKKLDPKEVYLFGTAGIGACAIINNSGYYGVTRYDSNYSVYNPQYHSVNVKQITETRMDRKEVIQDFIDTVCRELCF